MTKVRKQANKDIRKDSEMGLPFSDYREENLIEFLNSQIEEYENNNSRSSEM